MTYKEFFDPFMDRFISFVITEQTQNKVQEFAKNIVSKKMREKSHQLDNGSEIKRWSNGISGELVVEKLLGEKFVDWRIGESSYFNVPDLKDIGLNVGIKTVEYGKFPIIHKVVKRPEIIIVRKENRFFMCGLATKEVLTTYCSDDLILSPKLKMKNTKTGFYGFEHLIPFKRKEELIQGLNCKHGNNVA